MKAILILIALHGFAKASLLEDALLFNHCLHYGKVDTINVVTNRPSGVTKRLILHYGGGNATQISSPYSTVSYDTNRVLVIIPDWLDSAGVKTYPSGVLIQSEDSAGVNYGATYYCLERPTTAVRMRAPTRRGARLNLRADILGRALSNTSEFVNAATWREVKRRKPTPTTPERTPT